MGLGPVNWFEKGLVVGLVVVMVVVVGLVAWGACGALGGV